MNQENIDFFLFQANKLLKEIFEQLSKDFFKCIEVRTFDLPKSEESEDNSNDELSASAFMPVVYQEQLQSEFSSSGETAFMSKPFSDSNSIVFFLIFYESTKNDFAKRYETFCEDLCTVIFENLIEYWNKGNPYFYNSTLRGILINNALENLVIEVSKICSGYNDVAIYENINLSLLDILSDLCYQTYEKSESRGLIYFTDSVINGDYQFKFQNKEDFGPFSIENKKLIRKLLELTDLKKGIGIISDTNNIFGIGKIKDGCINYNATFRSNHIWSLSKGNTELISMKNGNLTFNPGQIPWGKFFDYVTKNLPSMGDAEIYNLYGIIKTVMDQQKGTILVVMKDAEKYLERYKDLSIIVEPVELNKSNVEKLSSIDGAIFMDEKCMCSCFGVILDGFDTGMGNRARGSRFNSSERFFNWCKNQQGDEVIVFVFSDDGNYNFFPELD